MSSVEIRTANTADAAALAAVYRNAYRVNRELGFPMKAETVDETAVSQWIREHWVYVAVTDGDIVGGVRVEATDPDRVKLSRLGVHEQHRRAGIGGQLVDHAEAAMRDRGYDTIWLTTPEEHPHLPAYYRQRGYEKTGEYPLDYRSYDEIVMEKPL